MRHCYGLFSYCWYCIVIVSIVIVLLLVLWYCLYCYCFNCLLFLLSLCYCFYCYCFYCLLFLLIRHIVFSVHNIVSPETLRCQAAAAAGPESGGDSKSDASICGPDRAWLPRRLAVAAGRKPGAGAGVGADQAAFPAGRICSGGRGGLGRGGGSASD
jgi:hypothetical protein